MAERAAAQTRGGDRRSLSRLLLPLLVVGLTSCDMIHDDADGGHSDAGEVALVAGWTRIALTTSDLPRFTVSFGVVAAAECASLEDAVRHADDSLYLAKARGRDCSVIADTKQFTEDGEPVRPLLRVAEKMRAGNGYGLIATLARDDDPMDR